MSEIYDLDSLENQLRARRIQKKANNRTKTLTRIRLELDEAKKWANPYEFNGGFKSIFVEKVSDPSAICYFKPDSPTEDQNHVQLAMRDSWAIDGESARAFFSWPAQPGKWIEIVIFFDSTFTSGSYTQISSGGVSLSDGVTVASIAPITLPANTPTIVAPADPNRKVSILQNKSGASIFLGDSTVTTAAGAKEGIEVFAGSIFEWRNAGALYAVCGAAGKVARLDEA